MINNDSVVTAYDEHLTLVEWLQKVEKLITENALESVQVNNVSASTYTLTLTFADGSSITSNTFDLSTITQALTLIEAKADTALNNSVANASEIAKIKNGTTPLFENITDSHGNKRFIEGNITMNTIEGVTQTYGKWSLSGTHLMVVIAFDIDRGVTTPANAVLAKFSLPDFIYAKIIRLWDYAVNVTDVRVRKKTAWYEYFNLNSIQLYKLDNPQKELEIDTSNSTITTTADSACRIQFDLLIDNE